MSESKFVTVKLENAQGVFLGSLRLKATANLPEILQWGARYFLRVTCTLHYREASCLFVLLEWQCGKPSEEIKPAVVGPRR